MYKPDNLFNDINVPSYMEKHDFSLSKTPEMKRKMSHKRINLLTSCVDFRQYHSYSMQH